MITWRRSNERGHAKLSWLDTCHTFSFAHYYDPRHMGVSVLRVLNDDWVAPEAGFPTHPHRDMEIISYVLEGEIEDEDTMGYHTRLKAGEVQVMSAGTGIEHSEFNPSSSKPLNFLQIWIAPATNAIRPKYAQRDFSDLTGIGLIASPDGRDNSLQIDQDAFVYKVKLRHDARTHPAKPGRIYYLHMARGMCTLNGMHLQPGDGVTIADEHFLNLEAIDHAEALLFELPA